MNSLPGYNPPQIQRTFLIPLAREFIASDSDRTSVDDFVSFVVKSTSTSCTLKNVKTWRKEALKALRLVNTEQMFHSPKYQTSIKQSLLHRTPSLDTKTLDEGNLNLSCKRPRTDIDLRTNENFVVRLPTIRLSHIAMTSPVTLRRQLKCFLRAHLNMAVQLPVWPSILISGPPFCGKTTLVEAVCGSLGAKLLTVSVGTVSANMKSWIDLFNQAKAFAPCVLHLDDVEGMEKHSTPTGAFRVTCLLKSRLLREIIGSGIAVVGETRSLLTALPQSVVDLFTQRLTFGMLSEQHRLHLFRRYLTEEAPTNASKMYLTEGLTCAELARQTPGYEAGDIIRLIAQFRMNGSLFANKDADSDMELFEEKTSGFESDQTVQFATSNNELESDGDPIAAHAPSTCAIPIGRALLEECLAIVIPAVKNTAEFVTIPDVTWADVGGLDSTKMQLHNRFMLLVDDWERAQALNRRSGGVLLEGPPGCGKTLVAKALSNQAGLNFLSVKGPEVLNMFQGESERRVREIFERARACQPCLIFFDEIDAICPRRDSNESSAQVIPFARSYDSYGCLNVYPPTFVHLGSRVSLVNQLLVELDGVDKHRSGRVFVIGATNRKDMIDPAVLRPGRLGLHIVINPPASANERASVLSACTRAATFPRIEGGQVSLVELANDPRTEGMRLVQSGFAFHPFQL
ncbi:ribosome biogenesis ATPase [Paragonimus westermani]|uniref:Ribosome biogenesis ATPase n=1 Tax=Paragonimus westermani TaxID=34504 RepID=A0A5J4N6A3_9TREM|nr:ribosome biogenesis ATPase [Paragonimus westermani]